MDYIMTKEKSGSDESKFRYWAFLVYEEDYMNGVTWTQESISRKLMQTFGMFAVSPVHQPDEDVPVRHFHVIYKHPGPCRLSTVSSFIKGIAYNNYFLPLHHPNVYQRYLVHLDNPEKEQFLGGAKEIEVVNGFPLDLMPELTAAQKFEIQKELETFADEYNIFEYASMVDYARENLNLEHYMYLTTHTQHFAKYLDSKRNSKKEMAKLNWQVEFEAKMMRMIEEMKEE